jgi:hypothetical protein
VLCHEKLIIAASNLCEASVLPFEGVISKRYK